MVLNLEDATLAVTQNFCNRVNVRRVLDGMKQYASSSLGFNTLRTQTLELIRQHQPSRPELFSAADLDWAAAAEEEIDNDGEVSHQKAGSSSQSVDHEL